MSGDRIVFENVSKFYGETLGLNGVSLSIPPGITGLVGPNGSGKTTLMNLMSGLIRPTRGRIAVAGISPLDPGRLFRILGYSTQFDAFPKGLTGREFIYYFLRLFGDSPAACRDRAARAIDRVRLGDAADRNIAGFSKGMRQRIKLAQAIAHDPRILVLDEPLNGLDPVVRAETIQLFREMAAQGRHVIVSTHILHEVDMISDQVILLGNGSVIAEGQIRDVRDEISEQPRQVMIRAARSRELAAKLFELDLIVDARLHADGGGLLVKIRDSARFYKALNGLVLEGFDLDSVAAADDDVNSVYEYLIGEESSK